MFSEVFAEYGKEILIKDSVSFPEFELQYLNHSSGNNSKVEFYFKAIHDNTVVNITAIALDPSNQATALFCTTGPGESYRLTVNPLIEARGRYVMVVPIRRR